MSKRYAYFRMPNGRPYRANDGKYAPQIILSEIGAKGYRNSEGSVSWDGFFMMKIQPALRSVCTLVGPDDAELNNSDTWRIIWNAIVDIVKKAPAQPVKPTRLIEEADKLAAEFFRQPSTPYVLVTSLSLEKFPANSISVRGCTVSPLSKRGSKFPLPRVLASHSHGSPFSKHATSSLYQLINVNTKGRSVHEAADNALNALDLLRGIWSLFATVGSWTISSGRPSNKPLGAIHAGPVHTLHFPDGKLVDDNSYWYDPDYTNDQAIFKADERLEKIEQTRRKAMKRIAPLKYRKELEDLLIRYASALDKSNLEIAFLQMWSILERITNTVAANYDETIRRTVWVYKNDGRSIAKEVLESLRSRRNRYVHSGLAGEERDQIAYEIKSFVDPHLLRLIANPYKVETLEEYGEFLALPTEVATLEQKRRRLTTAIRALTKVTK